MTLRVFIGYDPRQPLAYNVLQHSILANASRAVSITPLVLKTLPIKRRGLTQFTFSRFLVPYLCNYAGLGLFLDADMVVTGDIAELFEADTGVHQVLVNKDQQPFEWASAMLFDCAACSILTPEFIDNPKNGLLDFKWCENGGVGAFAPEWNKAVGYRTPGLDAKLYHFTKGIPIWRETKGNVEDSVFHEAYKAMLHSVSHAELMGNSVHVAKAS
jgi:lipopolysaccharide biosynthesis glycosyltransferase